MGPQPRWGAHPANWNFLDLECGLTEDLLPVVSNPQATISENSAMQSMGKTPSLYNTQRHVVGIKGWTQKEATSIEISRWAKEPDYGICLQTRKVRAIDIDVPDRTKSQEIQSFVKDFLLNAGIEEVPTRVRKSSGKCLIAFRLLGDFTKRSFKIKEKEGVDDPAWIVEFLAHGQQFVAFGTHPSGDRYEWALPFTDFPILSAEVFEKLWAELRERFVLPNEPAASKGIQQRKREPDLEMDDPIADFLEKRDLVLKSGNKGKLFIECPWMDQHSGDSGVSQTCYFKAGSSGYQQGKFHCFHAGCQNKSNADFEEALGVADLYFGDSPATPLNKKTFNLIPAHEFASLSMPSWQIKQVLPSKGLGMIFGGSGSGKTFLALDMMMAVCRGLSSWFGHKCTPGQVVYVAAEGAVGLRKRLKAYESYHDVPLIGLPIDFIDAAPDLTNKLQVERLTQSIDEKGKVNIVVIDTLAQTTPGADENAAQDMGKVFNHLREMVSKLDCLVLLVHHSGKDPSRGARGWSGMRAALDVEIEVGKDSGVRIFRVSKQKDGEDGGICHFNLQSVALGEDEDKEPITSCVVLKAEPILEMRVQGKWQSLVVTEAAGLLEFTNSVSVEILIQACLKAAPEEPGVDRDSLRDRIKRAVDTLTNKGSLTLDGQEVSFPQNYKTQQKRIS